MTSPFNYLKWLPPSTLENSFKSCCERNFFLICSSNFLFFFNIIPLCLSLSPQGNKNNLFSLSSECRAFLFPTQVRLFCPLMIFAAVLRILFNLSTSITRFKVQSHHCHIARKSLPCGQRNEDSARTDPNHTIPFCHLQAFQNIYIYIICSLLKPQGLF